MNKFFRRPTVDERQNFTVIGPYKLADPKIKFKQELGEKRLECIKNKVPFFKKAAMDDFEEHYKKQAKISLRKNGYVKPDEIEEFKINWNKYSDNENIEFIAIDEQRDSNTSKRYPFDVYVKEIRYKFKGYGKEGSYNIVVMEDEQDAVRRAKALYDNKPGSIKPSLAEKVSWKYGNDDHDPETRGRKPINNDKDEVDKNETKDEKEKSNKNK